MKEPKAYVIYATVSVTLETKRRIEKLIEHHETWSETLNRVLDVYEATRGAVPLGDEDMEFFTGEHRATGQTNAAETMSRLFRELRELREEDAKRRMRGDKP